MLKKNNIPVTHNVSCTIIVKQNEWDGVSKFLFENNKYFAAVSFISEFGDKLYKQAPLEAVHNGDEIKWQEIIDKYKVVDYNQLLEEDDQTNHVQELACAGIGCEL